MLDSAIDQCTSMAVFDEGPVTFSKSRGLPTSDSSHLPFLPDVLKALCLGAKAVGMGRPFLYAQSVSHSNIVHSPGLTLLEDRHTEKQVLSKL